MKVEGGCFVKVEGSSLVRQPCGGRGESAL